MRLIEFVPKILFFPLQIHEREREIISVESFSHFYVRALYNFKVSQRAVISTRAFLWDVNKGFSVK